MAGGGKYGRCDGYGSPTQWLLIVYFFWLQSTAKVWQALELTIGSRTEKFMNGKGTGQMFGALWLLQVFSRIVVVSFSLFFSISFFFHF